MQTHLIKVYLEITRDMKRILMMILIFCDKNSTFNRYERNLTVPTELSWEIVGKCQHLPYKNPIISLILLLFFPSSFFHSSRAGDHIFGVPWIMSRACVYLVQDSSFQHMQTRPKETVRRP